MHHRKWDGFIFRLPSSARHRFTLGAQITFCDVAASVAALFGKAIFSLITVAYVAARPPFYFGIAGSTHFGTADIRATATVLFSVTVGTFVGVTDIGARTAS
jgi:hypothetical protein